jgi:hypothetical protein
LVATNWTAIASLATAAGTLTLAAATFASIRSANSAARTAERAFQVGLRPVLFPSRLDDASQKVRWTDDHWALVPGGRATMEEVDQNLYMAMSLRNVGSGIAVLHSWRARRLVRDSPQDRPPLEEFRPQTRDLYVPPGDISFWQAAIRDEADPDLPELRDAIRSREPIAVDLLYGDHEGGQRTVSRFVAFSRGDEGDWVCTVGRHWNLDRTDPR